MPWDDFARVGAPRVVRRTARVLAVGGDGFPPALLDALSQAGLVPQDVAVPSGGAAQMSDREADLLICSEAALAACAATCARQSSCARPGTPPAILLRDARTAAENAPRDGRFAEILGTGQDALGFFLMLRATLRRKRPQALRDVLSFGPIALDQERFMLELGGVVTPLNLLEFRVLGAILDAPRLVWNKTYLNRVVFGPADLKPGRQFDTYMSRVRRGIRDRLGEDPLVAEHGRGYALAPAILGAAGIHGGNGVAREPGATVGALPRGA